MIFCLFIFTLGTERLVPMETPHPLALDHGAHAARMDAQANLGSRSERPYSKNVSRSSLKPSG